MWDFLALKTERVIQYHHATPPPSPMRRMKWCNGHGSWVMGQLCDGSHGSWVTKDDPFPSLSRIFAGDVAGWWNRELICSLLTSNVHAYILYAVGVTLECFGCSGECTGWRRGIAVLVSLPERLRVLFTEAWSASLCTRWRYQRRCRYTECQSQRDRFLVRRNDAGIGITPSHTLFTARSVA